ncbi:MAG: VOC family protein, partial [Leadbetterella sp.]|nr:VOC family protein [Leadbetterella sp.]
MKINFKLTLNCSIFIFIIFLTACTKKQKDNEPKINPLLGDGFGINGATIIVKNLNKARNYFTDTLGFSMPPAARFENGIYDNTRTASIFFADFSTFDLMANIDSVSKLTKKPIESAFLKQNKSLAIYSFSTSSADTTKKRLQLRGFKTDSIRKGRSRMQIAKGWDWDDGGPQWRSVEFESKNSQAHLPSYIEYTGLPYKDIQDEWKPAAWRKYYEKNPNGVV